jgi:hypothetical protein
LGWLARSIALLAEGCDTFAAAVAVEDVGSVAAGPDIVDESILCREGKQKKLMRADSDSRHSTAARKPRRIAPLDLNSADGAWAAKVVVELEEMA